MKMNKNTKYYDGTVYEFNLPTGHSCPHAVDCKVSVDRTSGKMSNESIAYRCYASSAERFPAVRNQRWTNFDYVKEGNKIIVPKGAEAIRIHSAGDFFSQSYFDMWCEVARENPNVEFWAYTKSLNFWVKRLDSIPSNLTLTASVGGRFDSMIADYNLKNVTVVNEYTEDMISDIDVMDREARKPNKNFYLLNNKLMKKFLSEHYDENMQLK